MSSDQNQPAQNMPILYQNPMPLDSKKHANLGLVPDFGLGFTRNVNAIPINMVEMPQVSHYYPIAFTSGSVPQPVAILGLRDKENLFLNDDNTWVADMYIPAYIRRYPFVFAQMADQDQLTLCVDAVDGVLSEDTDRKFFDEKNEATKLALNALEFCKSYQAGAVQTKGFCEALAESGLLADRHVKMESPSGQKYNLTGLQLIDEDRLKEMSDKDFLQWREKGWLPFIYAQLFSGVQWQRLKTALERRTSQEGPAE